MAFTQPFPTTNFKCGTSKETENITKSLRTENSHGYDEIRTKILKLSINYISSPLTHLCNRMLFTGIFPTRLNYLKYLNKEIKMLNLTIDLFIYLHYFQRFLKRLFIIEFIIILNIITSLQINNFVSGMYHQQTLRPII